MPNIRQQWGRITEWTLNRFTTSPFTSKVTAAGAIILIVMAIGTADYLTGIHLSLSFFYLIPVALAVVWIDWRAAVITAFCTRTTHLFVDYYILHRTGPILSRIWNSGASLLLFLVVIWILHALITLHRQLEARVAARTLELEQEADARRRLERELLEIASRERNAIGHELHDDLCQHLVGTALAAKVLAQKLGTNGGETQAIVGWLEEGVAKTRRIARGLLLDRIEPEEFNRELAELAAASGTDGIVCRFEIRGQPVLGDPAVTAQLFRIAQEAIRNAQRHAQASRVEIILSQEPTAIRLMIEDNGKGLPEPSARGQGMGLGIMAHRAAVVGGTLEASRTESGGTRIVCLIPATASCA